MMKKKVLSILMACITAFMLITPSVSVNAEPQNESTNDTDTVRSEYQKLTDKVNELNEKVEEYDSKISDLVAKIDDNKSKIDSINGEISKTDKEIIETKKDINNSEKVLGNRLREVYKAGGESSYLAIVFSSDNLSDLISRVKSAKTVVDLDNDMIKKLSDKKDELDNEVESLQNKSDKIADINEKIDDQKKEIEDQKAEQQKLVDAAKAEQDAFDKKYLAVSEREMVSCLVSIANDKTKSPLELKAVVQVLNSIKDNQLKSPTVINEVNAAINAANETLKSSGNQADTSGKEVYQGKVADVMNEVFKHLGKKYVWGATGPDTFDCSGLTSYVYRKACGIEIGRTTYDQINSGKEVEFKDLQPGDLIFPHSGHVAIYIGYGLMIHAPHTGDVVKVSTVYKFWRARRILN